METSVVGTVLKINVHFEKMCCMTMDDYDFMCEFYVYPNKKVTLTKSCMKRIDEMNYLAMVDTSVTGPGELMMVATAMIPDGDVKDGGMRKEVARCTTGVKITR